jgi:hypothetical protein
MLDRVWCPALLEIGGTLVKFLEWVSRHPILSVVLLVVLLGGIGKTVIGLYAVARGIHVAEMAVQQHHQ